MSQQIAELETRARQVVLVASQHVHGSHGGFCLHVQSQLTNSSHVILTVCGYTRSLLACYAQYWSHHALQPGVDPSPVVMLLQLRKETYSRLTPTQRLQVARHPNRPTCLDIILNITDKFVELHGDRAGLDDPAIVCGIGSMDGVSFMFIGHQKGRNTKVCKLRLYVAVFTGCLHVQKQSCGFDVHDPFT